MTPAAKLLAWHLRQGPLTDAGAEAVVSVARRRDPLFGCRHWRTAIATLERRWFDDPEAESEDGPLPPWGAAVTVARLAFDHVAEPLAAELVERTLDRLRALPPRPRNRLKAEPAYARLDDVETVIRAVADEAGVRLLEDPTWS